MEVEVKVSKRGISSLYFRGKRELALKLHDFCKQFPHRETVYTRKRKVRKKEVRETFAYYVLFLSPEQVEDVVGYLKKLEREEGVVLLPSSCEEDLKNKL